MHPETGRMWEMRARPARRRRAQPPEGRRQLRLAARHPRHRLQRRHHQPEQKPARHGRPGARLGAVDLACGLCFYTGDRFPGWKGSVFTGALSNDALFRIELDGERYRGEERLLVDRLPISATCGRGPTGSCTSSPTQTTAACSASSPPDPDLCSSSLPPAPPAARCSQNVGLDFAIEPSGVDEDEVKLSLWANAPRRRTSPPRSPR